MKLSKIKCKFCKISAHLPAWWTTETKAWKRWVLFLLSILLLTVIPFLIYSLIKAESEQVTILFWVLSGVVWILSLLGLLIAVVGCDSCASKALGRLDISF